MRTDHDQRKIISDEAIGKKVLCCMYLELVNEDTLEISPLLLPHGGILQDLADLLVKGPLVLLVEPLDPLLE